MQTNFLCICANATELRKKLKKQQKKSKKNNRKNQILEQPYDILQRFYEEGR